MKNFKTLLFGLLLASFPFFGKTQTPNYPYTTLIVPQVLIPGAPSGSAVAADGTGYSNGVKYVSVAPTGACSTTDPVEIVISTGEVYTCNNGTWGQSGGGGSGTGIVTVTDPPFNAKCDDTADDTAAINAAFASGASQVNLPFAGTSFIACKTSSTLTMAPVQYQTFNGNGSYLHFVGTSGNVLEGWASTVKNLFVEIGATSGTINGFHCVDTCQVEDYYDYFDTGTYWSGYNSMLFDNGANGSEVKFSLLDGPLTVTPTATSDKGIFHLLSDTFWAPVYISGQAEFTVFDGSTFIAANGTDYLLNITDSNVTFNSSNFTEDGHRYTGVYKPIHLIASNAVLPPVINGLLSITSNGDNPYFSGPFQGTLNISTNLGTSQTLYSFVDGVNTSILYSAAGTPLPTPTGPGPITAFVSDQTTTCTGNYVSGGLLTCGVRWNGTNWVTY